MAKKKKKINVGKDSVVIGDVSGEIGDGSVVIGPTDSKGNVILNQPMAVGRNAHAGPGSIAIGAGAGAGSNIDAVFGNLGQIIEASGNKEHIDAYMELIQEINKPNKDKNKISKLWKFFETLATLDGVQNLMAQASAFIIALLNNN